MNRPWLLALCVLGFVACPLTIGRAIQAQEAEKKAEAETKPEPEKKEAEKKEEAKPAPNGPLPGHSQHGEVFNEGPRQKAYLMAGMPPIVFPVTTKNPEAKPFVLQGIGQLHGFWYYEAERSFRQAAALDPDCAIAYWGMAMANIDNATRGKKFMEECQKRKANAGEHELMYIDALDAYLKADNNKKKERNEAYTKALEKILYKYPDDLEARSLLALQLWKNRDSGIPISSFLAVDALIDQVFAKNPMHPAHHYRIHLWDIERADNALASAALCGQSSPGIAHMWHMPGHIYSKTRRYDDACYQQEASARVDHAHMMRDRVLPDQIHNFAHNNEWLIRDLVFTGRARDAVDLAKNMVSLPRHPKYNTLDKGSSSLGRARLFDSLAKFEMWGDLLALSETPYLEATEKDVEQQKRFKWTTIARYHLGDTLHADANVGMIQQQVDDLLEDQAKAVTEAETKAKDEKKSEADVKKAVEEAKKKFDGKLNPLKKLLEELQGAQAIAAGDFKAGLELLKKAGNQDAGYLAWLQFKAGNADEAIKAAQANVSSHKNEVIPLVQLCEIQHAAGKVDDARKTFAELREISGQIDLTAPLFQRFAPLAKELAGQDGDWRIVKAPKADTGNRPSLDALGPFRWSPSPALDWRLKDADGKEHTLADYRGKPVIVVFFLGSGCLHCAEQIKAFGKAHSQFAAAGINIVAISSDTEAGLKRSIENYTDGPIPFPLLTDEKLAGFHAYRCYDDFEKLPLHGTFLIDGQGLVRWQDISFEPFQDTKFLLAESQRLLKQQLPTVDSKPTTPPMASNESQRETHFVNATKSFQSVGFVEFPKEIEVGAVSAVAIGKDDEIYVLQRGEVPLVAFDKDGKYLRRWGQGLFKVPHGLRVDREGNIWTTDNGNHVLRQFSREGKLIGTIGVEGKGASGDAGFKAPDDVVFDTQGNFYIADSGNGRIVKLSAEGKFVTAWGKKGKAEGEFATAHGLAIDAQDRIYVADRGNKRVQRFDTNGKHLDTWTFGGNPFGLIVVGDELIASEGDQHQMYHLDTAGKTVAKWGDPQTLFLPHLMAQDSRGRLYVSEVNGKRVQIFERR